jgi:CBS domain containing-hemolysin-like protein
VNWTALLIAIALLLANGFFVAAEFALLASRRSRVEQLVAEGARGAKQALAGISELSLMLAGAQLGITMASLGLGAIAEPAIAHGLETLLHPLHLPEGLLHGISFTIGLSIVVFLHMVIGEMAPKSLAIANPERAALWLAPPFRAFTWVTRPFIRVLNSMANAIVRMFGVEPQEELAAAHAPSDLLMLVRESAEHGTLAREQHGLLERALDLSGLDAEAAMTPRRDIIAVEADVSLDELERVAADSGRSRLPVYDDELDRMVGIVHVKDVLRVPTADRPSVTPRSLARPAFITVESRAIEDLMLEMREARAHVAIVVDEYGSVSGLVALEDLIEELIGDFDDETDAARQRREEQRQAQRRPDGSFVVPAALRPDELEDLTGICLPDGDYETLAGYVIAELERLPEVGDSVAGPACELEVTRVDGTRVVELLLRPHELSAGAPNGPEA